MEGEIKLTDADNRQVLLLCFRFEFCVFEGRERPANVLFKPRPKIVITPVEAVTDQGSP